MRRPVLWLALVIIVVILAAVIIWQRQPIADFFVNAGNAIFGVLGWGILLIAAFVLGLAFLILIKVRPAVLHWFRIALQFLGAVPIFFSIWAALGIVGVGGSFGRILSSESVIIGVLRILGFLILGIFLLAPVNTAHAIARFFRWLFGLFRREDVYGGGGGIAGGATYSQSIKPTPVVKPPEPKRSPAFIRPAESYRASLPAYQTSAATAPEASPSTAEDHSSDPPPQETQEMPAQQQPSQELKQVAQDVWKKYGESSQLVIVDGWKLPPIDILDNVQEVDLSPDDNSERAKRIEEALSSYGVEAKVVQINPGPTVTQFGLEPGWDVKTREIKEKDRDGNTKVHQEEVSRTRVKVERITSLANNLAMTLAAPSIRIEAPIPGKAVVGIEVPNPVSSVVTLRGVVETTSFQKIIAKTKMVIAMGKGAGGEAVAADLTKMPHLLIAGATGSGKTVCLNTIVCSLLMHNTPNDVLFIMVDPKRVELTPFNSIPHLAAPVIVETEKALNTLRWLSQEMDRRYKVMATANVRNIDGYNKTHQGEDRMPYLVLIIDELADLMMTGNSTEVEHNLCRLAQLARATGIHLVVATQRPSVDVVTGLIKANFPTRISFAVTSQVDSRTILDSVGAEKLLGKGDMLYMPTDSDKPKRLQGCYVSDPEVERLVYFWNNQNKDKKRPSLNIEDITVATGKKEGESDDAMLEEARKLAAEHESISTSFLQRRLRVGYPRAARIMEQLKAEGTDVEDDVGAGGDSDNN